MSFDSSASGRSYGSAPTHRRTAAPAFDDADRQLRDLPDDELLGLLLAGGRTRADSIHLARQLLAQAGSLAALPGSSRSLLRHHGLRDAQVSALLAACELACRFASSSIPHRLCLNQPGEVARFLALRYQQRDQEVMGALFLDVRHHLLADQEIFRGTLHRAAVEPREILKQCLLRGATGLVIFHTHPSGDPTPSAEDVLFTRRLAEAAAVVGVQLLDHLVLGTTARWVSLQGARRLVIAVPEGAARTEDAEVTMGASNSSTRSPMKQPPDTAASAKACSGRGIPGELTRATRPPSEPASDRYRPAGGAATGLRQSGRAGAGP
jgi:DNA repair protein RadC